MNDINAEYTQVLQVQSDNYQPRETYVYGVQRISNEQNNGKTFYQYDAKGSVIGQESNKKEDALFFKVRYNDFGQPHRKLDNEFGYNAEAHDYNGTQYLRARYYDTKNGRFDQRDSYMGEHGVPLSENRYTYVWNNPSKYIDPSGHRLFLDPGTDAQATHINEIANKADRQGISWEEAEDKYWKDDDAGRNKYNEENQKQAAATEKSRQDAIAAEQKKKDEISALEGKSGDVAKKGFAEALALGMSVEDAYRYAMQIFKICDSLDDVVLDKLIEKIEGKSVLEFFFVEKEYEVNVPGTNNTTMISRSDVMIFLNSQPYAQPVVDEIFLFLETFAITAYTLYAFATLVQMAAMLSAMPANGWVFTDPDGDGLPGVSSDPDGDGLPGVNPDPDGDGVPGVNPDPDGDGVPGVNPDPDGDGVPGVIANSKLIAGEGGKNRTNIDAIYGKPNSQTALYDSNGKLIQIRYYGSDGRAVKDVDYSHLDGNKNHNFPHDHVWDWSKKKVKRV